MAKHTTVAVGGVKLIDLYHQAELHRLKVTNDETVAEIGNGNVHHTVVVGRHLQTPTKFYGQPLLRSSGEQIDDLDLESSLSGMELTAD